MRSIGTSGVQAHGGVDVNNCPGGKFSDDETLRERAFEHVDDREKKPKRIAQALEDLSANLSKAGIITKTCIRGGMPPDTILEYVKTSASDLIVMGTHGRRGLSHLVAGSVTEAVLRQSTCPVLAVRTLPFGDSARRVIVPARSSG